MERLTDFARQDKKGVFSWLNTSETGLDSFEAGLRLEVYGPNQIATEKPKSWLVQLIEAFINPFSGILFFLAGISFVTDVMLAAPENRSWRTIIVITAMVLLSGMVRFIQEYRSSKEAEKLKAMVHTTAAVVRSGAEKQKSKCWKLCRGTSCTWLRGT